MRLRIIERLIHNNILSFQLTFFNFQFKCCGLEGPDDFKGFSLLPTTESNYFASSGEPKSCFDNKNNLMRKGFKEAIEYVPILIKIINILILLLTFLLLVNSN